MTNYLIKDLALEDRPRERLILHGPKSLSMAELVAILLGTGTRKKSALDLARELTEGEDKVRALATLSTHKQLANIKGLGPAKAAILMAAIELGKRIALADTAKRKRLAAPEDGALLLMPRLRYEINEHFMLVLLNTKNRVIGLKQISEGSLNSSVVHPREVFAPAVAQHAAAILVGHNHPSGDPEPSREDKELTAVLVKTGNILGIPLIDHIIIGDGIYYSFKEHGYL